MAAFFIFSMCVVVLPCRCQCWSTTVLYTIIWLMFMWLQLCLFYIITLRYVITRSANRMAIEAQWSKRWYHAWKLCCLNSWWCCSCGVHRSLWEKKSMQSLVWTGRCMLEAFIFNIGIIHMQQQHILTCVNSDLVYITVLVQHMYRYFPAYLHTDVWPTWHC